MTEKTYDKETLERILAERDARHQAELEKLKAELKLQNIETRLAKLEESSDQEDSSGSIGGFKIQDIVQAYVTYQQMTSNGKTA
jgi:hypothetical protein